MLMLLTLLRLLMLSLHALLPLLARAKQLLADEKGAALDDENNSEDETADDGAAAAGLGMRKLWPSVRRPRADTRYTHLQRSVT
jgi:hypothetical protein